MKEYIYLWVDKCKPLNDMGGKDGFLVFSNAGDFIPKSIERVINSDAPEIIYRNPFLVSAMVNLNMIDSVGRASARCL